MALYWAEVYNFVYRNLQANTDLQNACLVVRYEDLCGKSEETIDRIVRHAELDKESFLGIKRKYCRLLHQPVYYKAKYSKEEQEIILQVTAEVATKFGYDV